MPDSLDAPLTDEERAALRDVVLCRRGRRAEPTHRDLKAIAQVALAMRRKIEADRKPEATA